MNELSRTLSEAFPVPGLHTPSSMHVASLHPCPIKYENSGSRLGDSMGLGMLYLHPSLIGHTRRDVYTLICLSRRHCPDSNLR
jgi:hypothetical protein